MGNLKLIKIRKYIIVGLLVMGLFACSYTVMAEQTSSESYPTHEKLAESDLFKYKAKLYLEGDEVWLKLTVRSYAEQGYTFLIGCRVPCVPSGNWGHPHFWIYLEPKEKFIGRLRVRPAEMGWRTNLVPVFIGIFDGVWQYPYPPIIYSGSFMLEIPEKWDFVTTT